MFFDKKAEPARALEDFDTDYQKCDVEFDFYLVDVLSIERNYQAEGTNEGTNERPTTIISFIKGDSPEILEWSFTCNKKQHDYLVSRFRNHLKRKNPEISVRLNIMHSYNLQIRHRPAEASHRELPVAD